MPSRPYVYRLPQAARLLDLTELHTELSATEDQRQQAYDASRKIQAALVNAKTCLELPCDDTATTELEQSAAQELHDLVVTTVGAKGTRQPREGNLNFKVEDVVRYQAFIHFLQTGTLLPPSATAFATDEEYLASACMGLSQDLARYGMGRATARDVASVTQAKDLVQDILAYLLQFDFRNGPLRRKYDGTKYALRSLETLLYELAVTGSSAIGNDYGDVDMNDAGTEKPPKHHKPNDDGNDDKPSSLLLAQEELTALRERMEHRDNLRENLIKRCRDGQKAAKQSIFALHRGDVKRAKTLLETCAMCIQNDLLPIVQEEPCLRYGTFGNVMEEYAEAKLFYAWLYGTNSSEISGQPPAILLRRDEFEPFTLDPSEYLGGLCDLTGEIGRYAVQRATSRDALGVKLSLQSSKQVLMALEAIDRLPRDIGKKMEPLRRTVEKLERILYEMSLSEAAGGRHVQTNSMDMESVPKEGDANDD